MFRKGIALQLNVLKNCSIRLFLLENNKDFLAFISQTGRSRGYCFVYFESLKSSIRAVESSANLRIDSRYVRVDYSMTTRPRSPGYYERHKEYDVKGGGGGGYGMDHSRHRRSSQRNGRGHSPSPRRKYYYILTFHPARFHPFIHSCIHARK